MGTGKLNVWVRNTSCEVVDRTGHLHIYDCHGKSVLVQWFHNGHIEVEVPPGCYILTAGVVYGNIYTDKTMVVVKCGEKVCVNLVLTKFLAQNPPPLKEQPLMYYCPLLIALPIVQNAPDAGIKQEELHRTIDVIARAARMDKEIMLNAVRKEIKMMEENIQHFTDKERADVEKYISLLKKIFQSGKKR